MFGALQFAVAAQAGTVTELAENFDTSERALFVGPSIPWLNGYLADAWSTAGPLDGREGVYCLTDDEGGLWGQDGPVDNHLTYTGQQWRDFVFTAKLRDDGDDGIGYVFRFVDASNFYIWAMADGDKIPAVGGGSGIVTGSKLYRVRNGVGVELASSSARNERTRWEDTRVVVSGNRIQAYLDANNDGDALDSGDLVFDVTDTAPEAINVVGRVGLYCYNSGAEATGFDDVTVQIDDANPDGDSVPDARDLCPGVFDAQTDLDGDRLGDACDPDADADGFGKATKQPDCNDLDASVYPGATEVCDAVDQDCDGDMVESFANADLDKTPDCADPDDDNDGAPDAKDCAPFDPARYPGAVEACDALDSDCDGDLVDGFPDTDGDKTADCLDPDDDNDGSPDAKDCRPLDKTVFPGAAEVCDAIDQDCDGDLVETFPDANRNKMPDCADTDDDGDGDPDVSDCAPLDAAIHAGATETCDGKDQDCDKSVDEGAIDAKTWFADGDGDAYGDPADTTRACARPGGYVPEAGDCDDSAFDVNPDAAESCNGFDDDCDGGIDDDDPDGVLSAPRWYRDGDDDGFVHEATTVQACQGPAGFLPEGTALDCDDGETAVNPDADEVACNEVDDDCDGTVDADASDDPPSWWPDGDNDGYGDAGATPEAGCTPPSAGYVGNAEDCDDGARAVNPDAVEVPGNGVDDDCDPATSDALPDTGVDADRPYDASPPDTGAAVVVGEACGCRTSAAPYPLAFVAGVLPWLLRRRRSSL